MFTAAECPRARSPGEKHLPRIESAASNRIGASTEAAGGLRGIPMPDSIKPSDVIGQEYVNAGRGKWSGRLDSNQRPLRPRQVRYQAALRPDSELPHSRPFARTRARAPAFSVPNPRIDRPVPKPQLDSRLLRDQCIESNALVSYAVSQRAPARSSGGVR